MVWRRRGSCPRMRTMRDLRKFWTYARNWDALGETDPLFGVLSDPAKFGGQWNAEEFFASGQAHVQKLHDTLAALHASFNPGTCLDFGCGVGRLPCHSPNRLRTPSGLTSPDR